MLPSVSAIDRTTVHRAIGLVVLVAFVIVLLAGFAHVGEAHDGAADMHDCGLCLALITVAVALPFLAASLERRRAPARTIRLALVARSVAASPSRPPPARGPPFVL